MLPPRDHGLQSLFHKHASRSMRVEFDLRALITISGPHDADMTA